METALQERFLDRILPEPNTGCWLWTGGRTDQGYGAFYLGQPRGKQQWIKAHRFAYRLIKGEIPEGLQLDHLCRVRICVNPDHLEPVTNAENHFRARGKTKRPIPVVCLRGHEEYVIKSNGQHRCQACAREQAMVKYRADHPDAKIRGPYRRGSRDS